VWDVLSDQQACDSVRRALESVRDGDAPAAAARQLAGQAYEAGSTDNISVIVAVVRRCLT
jgi:serine/threonine protein phosphatase PrpC